ncbi:AAA family ATPase [Celeribacter litoreus]|uniref:AAA family ATPase n=1 Tax=Celeribacter litoreus TaxID=2876714 RepID=UPI001CCC92DC|nr:AAA family ATPase [Celeribacter litoreus]MCA0044933.1 AAA family ATPase [Celeribacter litoreus]
MSEQRGTVTRLGVGIASSEKSDETSIPTVMMLSERAPANGIAVVEGLVPTIEKAGGVKFALAGKVQVSEAAGEVDFHTWLAVSAKDRWNGLTEREKEIATHYSNGSTYRDIADIIHRSPSTVRNHLTNIFRKLDIGNKLELHRLMSDAQNRAPIVPSGGADPTRSDKRPAPTATDGGEASEHEQIRHLVFLAVDVACDETDAQNDLERERACFERVSARISEEVRKVGGTVISNIGSRIVACTGWPYAHENQTEQAVEVALSLLSSDRSTGEALTSSATLRIGISSGRAIVSDLKEHGISGQVFPGSALQRGSILVNACPPNGILIDADTYAPVQGAVDAIAPPDEIAARLSGPVQALLITGSGLQKDRFSKRTAPQMSKLVGRTEELGLLVKYWRSARDGNGEAVHISGEAGIGKSRIMRELCAVAEAQGAETVLFQCAPEQSNTPLFPVIAQLNAAIDMRAKSPGPLSYEERAAILGEIARERDVDTVVMEALLGMPSSSPHDPFHKMTKMMQRAYALNYLTECILSSVDTQPIILIFEDIHWADQTTLELLDRLIAAAENRPALVLFSSRPAEFHNQLEHANLTRLEVSRLSSSEARRLAEQFISGDGEVDQGGLDSVLKRADGIPLFVEELARVAKVDRGADDVPRTLLGQLLMRVDELPVERDVLVAASVLGRTFSLHLLSQLTGRSNARLMESIYALRDAGILFAVRGGKEGTFNFKHALIRDAVYQSATESRRRDLHRGVAECLLAYDPQSGARNPELLAVHLSKGGEPARSLPYWIASARAALTKASHKEALAFVRRGLDEEKRAKQTPQTLSDGIDLRFLAYAAGGLQGGPDALVTLLREADDSAQKIGDDRRRAKALSSLTYLLASAGLVDEAISVGKRSVSLVTGIADNDMRVMSYLMLNRALYAKGAFDSAIDVARKGIEYLGDAWWEDHREVGLLNQYYNAIGWLILSHSEKGDFEEAADYARKGESRFALITGSTLHERIWLSHAVGHLHLVRGDAAAVIDEVEPIMEQSLKNFPAYVPRLASSLGVSLVRLGRADEGLKWLKDADTTAGKLSFRFGHAQVRTKYAEALQCVGDYPTALEQARSAFDLARATGEKAAEAWALCISGEIAQALGRLDDARAWLQKSQEMAGAMKMDPLLSRIQEARMTL